VSKRTGTSNRIEIQFRIFSHLSRPDSFVKLFETLCLCLSQGNDYMGQIRDKNLIPLMSNFKPEMDFYSVASPSPFAHRQITWLG
jgi:hypothetical protein